MVEVVTSASQLGSGAGIKGVRLPSGHIEWLAWDEGSQAWLGKPKFTMRMVSDYGQSVGGAATSWRYPASTVENPGYKYAPNAAYGFQIHKVALGGEYWASGLRMQENLSAHMRTMGDGGAGIPDPQIALSWFPLDSGGAFLSPAAINHGVPLVNAYDKDVAHFRTSGWQNTPPFDTNPTVNQILYPEVYLTGPNMHFRHFTAQHRWMYGGDTVSQPASTHLADNMIGWWRASDLPQADGTGVSALPDWSGVGTSLKQTDTTKQPVVMTEGSIRFLRFDGVNDRLFRSGIASEMGGVGTDIQTAYSAPITVFMVARQRSGGGGTQMWLQPFGGGATMIYSNGTSEVHVWAGGGSGDQIGTTTFGNWRVYSMKVLPSAAGSIWEDLTPISNATNAGSAGFDGFTMGNSQAEDFPAKIDVAEAFVIWRDVGNTERTNLVNAMKSKYVL